MRNILVRSRIFSFLREKSRSSEKNCRSDEKYSRLFRRKILVRTRNILVRTRKFSFGQEIFLFIREKFLVRTKNILFFFSRKILVRLRNILVCSRKILVRTRNILVCTRKIHVCSRKSVFFFFFFFFLVSYLTFVGFRKFLYSFIVFRIGVFLKYLKRSILQIETYRWKGSNILTTRATEFDIVIFHCRFPTIVIIISVWVQLCMSMRLSLLKSNSILCL